MCSNAHLNLNSSIIDHDQPDCNLSFSLKQLELSDKYDENDEKTVKLDSPYPPISMREPIRIEKKNKGKEENSKIYPKEYKISSGYRPPRFKNSSYPREKSTPHKKQLQKYSKNIVDWTKETSAIHFEQTEHKKLKSNNQIIDCHYYGDCYYRNGCVYYEVDCNGVMYYPQVVENTMPCYGYEGPCLQVDTGNSTANSATISSSSSTPNSNGSYHQDDKLDEVLSLLHFQSLNYTCKNWQQEIKYDENGQMYMETKIITKMPNNYLPSQERPREHNKSTVSAPIRSGGIETFSRPGSSSPSISFDIIEEENIISQASKSLSSTSVERFWDDC